MKILSTAPKAETWPKRLLKMEVDDTIHVAITSASTVRQAISRVLPYQGYDLKFKTKVEKNGKKKVLNVTRVA